MKECGGEADGGEDQALDLLAKLREMLAAMTNAVSFRTNWWRPAFLAARWRGW